eukprot:4681865-Lingulodinium_polyedra.AAC.1
MAAPPVIKTRRWQVVAKKPARATAKKKVEEYEKERCDEEVVDVDSSSQPEAAKEKPKEVVEAFDGGKVLVKVKPGHGTEWTLVGVNQSRASDKAQLMAATGTTASGLSP